MIFHFRSSDRNRKILKDGFDVLPFASEYELTILRRLYKGWDVPNFKGTYVSMFNPSVSYRKTIDNCLKNMFEGRATDLMNDYKVLYANMITKMPGPEGDFPFHQDWSYVDESRFSSYAIWVPLDLTHNTNGAVHVIGASHKMITALRGPFLHEPFRKISSNVIKKYSTIISLRPGEALVWDHRLIHFSLPNLTQNPRIAFTLIMVPRAAPIYHCFGWPRDEETTIQKFRVDTDFFMHYSIGSPPVAVPLIETIVQKNVDFSESEFVQKLDSFN